MSPYGRRRTIRYSAVGRHYCALPLMSVWCWNNARSQSPLKYETMTYHLTVYYYLIIKVEHKAILSMK